MLVMRLALMWRYYLLKLDLSNVLAQMVVELGKFYHA